MPRTRGNDDGKDGSRSCLPRISGRRRDVRDESTHSSEAYQASGVTGRRRMDKTPQTGHARMCRDVLTMLRRNQRTEKVKATQAQQQQIRRDGDVACTGGRVVENTRHLQQRHGTESSVAEAIWDCFAAKRNTKDRLVAFGYQRTRCSLH